MNRSRFFILNSFDRSGSTLISRAISGHSGIECLYNPFNSSVFRREFMRSWNESTDAELQQEGKTLFDHLLDGRIDPETIRSKVFFANSSTTTIEAGKVYLIKTTNLHLKIRWIKSNYPDVKVYALARNPLGILASLVRNDFHQDWYGEWAYTQLHEYIRDAYFREEANFLLSMNDAISRMAVIIGVLNAAMLEQIPMKDTLKYEEVISNPNCHLKSLIREYTGGPCECESFFKSSINSVGKPFDGTEQYKRIFTRDQIKEYCEIFNVCGDLGYNLSLG